jgi:DNA-binding transcriptional ArsR family regulator
MALAALQRPGVHAVHLPWVRWAKTRLPQVAGLRLLLDLAGNDLAKPSYLLPPPDDRLPALGHELRRIAATSPTRVREELATLHVDTPATRRLADDPRRGLRDAVEALAACHSDLVAPHWTRMQRLLEADIVHRAGLLAAGGLERLFADLHDQVVFADGDLVVHRSRPPHDPPPVRLRGNGLVLCPSVFCWPRVTAGTRPVAAGTLRYPARGVATLWESPEPASDALVALVGRTRAMMLYVLAQPATTGDLATRLDVTPGAISQHLGVLRGAGLVTTSRDGRVVLHLRTERAEALLS